MIPDKYQLKIGDIVRIVSPPLDVGRRTPDGLSIPRVMEEYYGGIYTISSVSENHRVTLGGVENDIYEWWWDRWCLELVTENDINFDGVEELL